MKLLCEKLLHTEDYVGKADLITGIDYFEIKAEYDKTKHAYIYNNKALPSVSSILDEGEYDNIDEKILEYAKRKGTLVHKEIQDFLESGIKGFTSEFYEFLSIYTNNSELFENKAIFDFKTNSVATPKVRKKCYRQIKMYADGVEYLTGIKIENYYMIHLPHNKKGRLYDLMKEFGNGNN